MQDCAKIIFGRKEQAPVSGEGDEWVLCLTPLQDTRWERVCGSLERGSHDYLSCQTA